MTKKIDKFGNGWNISNPDCSNIFSDLNIPYIPLYCKKITISTNFFLIFIYLRRGGNLKQKLSDDEKIDKNHFKILKCKIDIKSV
jgi:hypothetical protein